MRSDKICLESKISQKVAKLKTSLLVYFEITQNLKVNISLKIP